jgi:hypothetical protein
MLLLPGFAVGILLGVIVTRGDVCMQSAAREVLAGRPSRMVRIYLVALGAQMALVHGLAGLGWLQPVPPPVAPLAAVVGGATFGTGMLLAKG